MSNKKSNQNKQCTVYIDGMHCASCEVLIEKKLLDQDNIEFADASLAKSRVAVTYTGNKKPDIKSLNKDFKDMGYTFSEKKFPPKDLSPAISLANGELTINPEKMKKAFNTLAILISFIALFIFIEKSQFGKFISISSSSSLGAFFVLGLVAAASSCAALVGGVLLSLIKQWNDLYIGESTEQKATPHILFHTGRLISFTVLGGVLGLMGNVISLDNVTVYSMLIIGVSAVMFILAMQMLEVKWAQRFSLSAPKFITRSVSDEKKFAGKYMPFITGALTFFLPCGFTLIAQGAALTTGSFFSGALVMLLFSLGTLPVLAGISFSGVKMNSKPHLTARFNKIAGLLVLFFVMYNVNSQMNVLGLPSLSDISFERKAVATGSIGDDGSDGSSSLIGADGIQRITFKASGFTYTPTSSTTIQSGIPTILEMDNQGIQGCGAFMAARGLIDGFVTLKSGLNSFEINPQPGTYKLTCSMGMVPPVTIEVI